MKIDQRVRYGLLIMVGGVWGVSMLAGLFPALGVQPDPQIHAVFMFVVGAVYAIPTGGIGRKGRHDDTGPSGGDGGGGDV